MRRVCDDCGISYDDAVRTTICPHERFISDGDAARKDLAASLLGKSLRFAHDADGMVGTYRIESIVHDGMVTLRAVSGQEMDGLFAPHCFVVVDVAEPKACKTCDGAGWVMSAWQAGPHPPYMNVCGDCENPEGLPCP